jgi:hypothetical protein
MTTQVRIRADNTGTMAIYTVDSVAPDDLPFSTPLSYLSRVRFHSGLRTPRIISANTYSVTLSAIATNSVTRNTYTVAAHGQSGTPLIFGSIPALGISMCGTVPILATSAPTRFITLGADATNIVLHEEVVSAAIGLSATTISLNVKICDFMIDGSVPSINGTDAEYIQMTPTLVKAQRGNFRSNSKYLRAASGGTTFPVPKNQTMRVMLGSADPNGGNVTALRYSCNGYTLSDVPSPYTGFNATVQLVRTE